MLATIIGATVRRYLNGLMFPHTLSLAGWQVDSNNSHNLGQLLLTPKVAPNSCSSVMVTGGHKTRPRVPTQPLNQPSILMAVVRVDLWTATRSLSTVQAAPTTVIKLPCMEESHALPKSSCWQAVLCGRTERCAPKSLEESSNT